VAVANRLLGDHRSRRIPLVGVCEGEMTSAMRFCVNRDA
jgi:hypothetical protein